MMSTKRADTTGASAAYAAMRNLALGGMATAISVVGGACFEGPQVCASGLICPQDSQCAAAQDVCIDDSCGNQVIDRGEDCDDGNVRAGDGCSPLCRREIAAGGAHTCMIVDGRSVRCWGLGDFGQLGRGMESNLGDDEPAFGGGVYVGGPVEQLIAGLNSTCALLQSGAVRCWGLGFAGQLGYGNTETIGDNEVPAERGDVALGSRVKQLAAGSFSQLRGTGIG